MQRQLLVYLILLLSVFQASQSFSLSLEEKLQLQWKQYDNARSYLVKKVAQENGMISRDEWEELLKLPNNEVWTKEDIIELQDRQNKSIELAEQLSIVRDNSTIDLETIRRKNKIKPFCKELPKGGMLHTHPWGTASKETVKTILDVVNPQLNIEKNRDLLTNMSAFTTEIDFLEKYNLFLNKESEIFYNDLNESDKLNFLSLFFYTGTSSEFPRFLASFKLGASLFFQNNNAWDSIEEFEGPEDLLWNDFFARSKDENLIYVETNKNVRPDKDWSVKQVKKVVDLASQFDISTNIIVQFARENEDSVHRENIKSLINNPIENVVAINLVNDEGEYPLLESAQGLYGILLKSRMEDETDLKATIHAGELGDVKNMRDAMIFGVDRIGHGVKLWLDPVALEYARTYNGNGLPLETNLTSNKLLKIVEKAGLKKHPWLDFFRLGLRVSFSTDDEGIFDTTISKECELAVSTTNVTYDELKEIVYNSIYTSFSNNKIKYELLEKLNNQFEIFEANW